MIDRAKDILMRKEIVYYIYNGVFYAGGIIFVGLRTFDLMNYSTSLSFFNVSSSPDFYLNFRMLIEFLCFYSTTIIFVNIVFIERAQVDQKNYSYWFFYKYFLCINIIIFFNLCLNSDFNHDTVFLIISVIAVLNTVLYFTKFNDFDAEMVRLSSLLFHVSLQSLFGKQTVFTLLFLMSMLVFFNKLLPFILERWIFNKLNINKKNNIDCFKFFSDVIIFSHKKQLYSMIIFFLTVIAGPLVLGYYFEFVMTASVLVLTEITMLTMINIFYLKIIREPEFAMHFFASLGGKGAYYCSEYSHFLENEINIDFDLKIPILEKEKIWLVNAFYFAGMQINQEWAKILIEDIMEYFGDNFESKIKILHYEILIASLQSLEQTGNSSDERFFFRFNNAQSILFRSDFPEDQIIYKYLVAMKDQQAEKFAIVKDYWVRAIADFKEKNEPLKSNGLFFFKRYRSIQSYMLINNFFKI